MLLQGERLQIILSMIKRTGLVRVDDLAKSLGASENSIRRDLKHLEERQMVERVYGGAVPVNNGRDQLVPFNKRSRIHPEEKLAIALAAVELIKPDSSILLDAGSTVYALAERINEAVSFPLTIVTNSLDTAALFAHSADFELLLCGGSISQSPRSLVGPYAESFFSQIHTDILFLGASGMSDRGGLTNSNMDEIGVKRGMIGAADRTVVLLDSSKIGRTATYPITDLQAIHTIVTDSGVSEEVVRQLEDNGVNVVIARRPTAVEA